MGASLSTEKIKYLNSKLQNQPSILRRQQHFPPIREDLLKQSSVVEFNLEQGFNYKKLISKAKRAHRVYRNINLFPDGAQASFGINERSARDLGEEYAELDAEDIRHLKVKLQIVDRFYNLGTAEEKQAYYRELH